MISRGPRSRPSPWPLRPDGWSRAAAPPSASPPRCGAAPLPKGLAWGAIRDDLPEPPVFFGNFFFPEKHLNYLELIMLSHNFFPIISSQELIVHDPSHGCSRSQPRSFFRTCHNSLGRSQSPLARMATHKTCFQMFPDSAAEVGSTSITAWLQDLQSYLYCLFLEMDPWNDFGCRIGLERGPLRPLDMETKQEASLPRHKVSLSYGLSPVTTTPWLKPNSTTDGNERAINQLSLTIG